MTVLILAPHTDDAEFGCGATIHKIIRAGEQVFQYVFSFGTERRSEYVPAWKRLGGDVENIYANDFQVRMFPENRQAILEEMIRVKRKIDPHLVFLPSSSDTHQDHEVIANEGWRAFKDCSVLGYEMPWNTQNFSTQLFYQVSDENLHAKIEALSWYETQKDRSYMDPEFIQSLARVRGVQSQTKYAEAFEVKRWKIE